MVLVNIGGELTKLKTICHFDRMQFTRPMETWAAFLFYCHCKKRKHLIARVWTYCLVKSI